MVDFDRFRFYRGDFSETEIVVGQEYDLLYSGTVADLLWFFPVFFSPKN